MRKGKCGMQVDANELNAILCTLCHNTKACMKLPPPDVALKVHGDARYLVSSR